MLTGFEALGAASAVLQVISFATDVVLACKNAYDGATTSQDDLQRYAGQMSEAVGRVHTRCEQMRNANSKFASTKLQDVAKQCKEAANKLEAEVQYVTCLQAKGDLARSLRKAFRASRHEKKIQALHESLSMYQQVVITEITSHLCSQSDAIYLQQDASFGKLDIDVQFLISQLAQGITDVENLVKHEHTATRNIILRESARAEVAINSHIDDQVLELRATAETNKKSEVFLQSLKAPLMNHRYNDIMESTEASFNQVFASYEDMKTMYHCDSENGGPTEDDDQEDDNPEDVDSPNDYTSDDDGDAKSHEIPEAYSDSSYDSLVEHIHQSWASLNSWLQSTDKLFYIQGKPGSGKSTLIKFIRNQEQTEKLLQRWSPDATILSYFFWKIGSVEQKSLKGLWCSLLYQRLELQQHLIQSILQRFNYLSRHSEYYDWGMKDLQTVWNYLAEVDTRHLCIFIDGLDEIRDEDGFSKLLETIDAMSIFPQIKLCVSTRPEASIIRWLKTKKAAGVLLEDLTKYDMLVFVRNELRGPLLNSHVSSESIQKLRCRLVDKAQGVFLWLYLATRSLIEGIKNVDPENMLFARLNALPGDLENLYIDLWQRMNSKSPVYVETARRYFRYVLQHSGECIAIFGGHHWILFPQPWIFQITCGENPKVREQLLKSTGTIELTEVLRMCEDTKASIQSRCAGLLEVQPDETAYSRLFGRLGNNSNALSHVVFIHRTAHDFLTDTEAGRAILGRGPLSDFASETLLLNSLIYIMIVLASECPLVRTNSGIIYKIADFAKSWGSKSLPLAIEMLNTIRPLYDRKSIIRWGYPWEPSDPFLSLLTTDYVFDDFVISSLATETSSCVATSILRQGWTLDARTRSFRKPSERLFFALIKLGADPHEYGTLFDQRLEPFVVRQTAFTTLLLSFIISTKYPEVEHPVHIDDESHGEDLLKTSEMAMCMAATCQNLDAVVALFSFTLGAGPMVMVPFGELFSRLGNPPSHQTFMVYEVDIQFLLLYLLSIVSDDLAHCILAAPETQDVLARIDRPLVKIRYFSLPLTEKDTPEPHISSPRTFQRILSSEPLSISDIEQLFAVDFDGLLQNLRKPREDKTTLYTTKHCIKNLDTEEINVEDLMTSLAAEKLGFCTYEEAGITPSYAYLRKAKEMNSPGWKFFPLVMGRLEGAAAIREGIKGHE